MPTNPHCEAVEQQVCSLELAAKLKQLGIQQKSLFYWAKFFYLEGKSHQWGVEAKEQNELEAHEYGHTKIEDVENCSAFTAAELADLLPRRNKHCSDKLPDEQWSNEYWCRIGLIWSGNDEKNNPKNAYSINYYGDSRVQLMGETIVDVSLANAIAKMLIYLIEHNLYDPQTQKKQN